MNHELGEALAHIRAFLTEETGFPDVHVDAFELPERLRDLSALAVQFGIGDDGTRPAAISMLPADAVLVAEARLEAAEPELTDWLAEGPWSNERNAVAAMAQGIRLAAANYPSRRLVAPQDPAAYASLVDGLLAARTTNEKA